MQTKVAGCAIAAVGIALISVSGEVRAPEMPQSCRPAVAVAVELAEAPLDPVQQAIARNLARRYYVAASETERFVAVAYRAAHQVGLDPLLVLAVISIESRFNPIAQSVMGAKGLMQIIPKYHYAKLDAYGGEAAVLDPESNILVGTRILKEYVRRTGTLQAGLQFYNGALWDDSAQYAQKVFAERERLQAVARAAESGSV